MGSALLPIVLVVTTIACQNPSDGPDARSEPVVATWAGGSLTAGEVRDEMAKLPTASRNDPVRKRELVDRLIANRLLFAEGTRRGYGNDPDIVRQLDALRERLVVQRMIRELRTLPAVSEEEAHRYYDENVSLYSTTRVRASHILLADEATAQSVAAEAIAHPDRFQELARDHSTDQTSAKRGGDLGMFSAGRMVPEFERAAFALPVGAISAPVKTRYGWHVIRVTERQDGETRPFASVKTQITSLLANRKVEEHIEATLQKLRSTAGVHVDEERLAAIAPPVGGATSPHGGIASH